ncbi:MAG: hypothetical protein M5U01_10050 [Ardenticatenaceae bacterium]|nr:hypothetical protein [Ardenticatenaceae bacterium]
MKLLVDGPSARRFRLAGEVNDRRYYVTRGDDPARAILVLRKGLDLDTLGGYVVDARIGWEAGWVGFVPEEEAGARYTRVAIYRRIPMPSREAERSLEQILAEAPRRTGG